MKRAISLFLALALMLTLAPLALGAANETPPYTEYADKLHALGLFLGTGSDASGQPIYELSREQTRAEALVMLIRLLGEEDEARAWAGISPFDDCTGHWAAKYIGYAAEKQYTDGTSKSKFEPDIPTTANMYLTFLLRVLGYNDKAGDFSYGTAYDKAAAVGLCSKGEYASGTFLRSDCVFTSWNALGSKLNGGARTLARTLVDAGIIDEATAKKLGLDVAEPAVYLPVIQKSAIVPVSQLGVYSAEVITPALIAKAVSEQPLPTAEALPYWTGFMLAEPYDRPNGGEFGYTGQTGFGGIDEYYDKDIVRQLADWGFNYLRVNIDYKYLFDDEIALANLEAFEDIDRLISWGCKYGVHINLQLYDMPGWWIYDTAEAPSDLFQNTERQAQCCEIYRLLASRYVGVPNNVLTFTLLNEPMTNNGLMHGQGGTAEQWTALATRFIAAIRSSDPDRLILANTHMDNTPKTLDGVTTSSPTLALKDEGIAQSFHFYPCASGIELAGDDGLTPSGYLSTKWPDYFYAASLWVKGTAWGSGSAPLKIRSSDADGKLDKDTVLTFTLSRASSWRSGGASAPVGTVIIQADGATLKSEALNPIAGAGGCAVDGVGDYTFDGSVTYSVTLPANTEQVTVSFDGGSWVMFSEVTVELPGDVNVSKLYYHGNADAGPNAVTRIDSVDCSFVHIEQDGLNYSDYTSTVTINADGSYSTDKVRWGNSSESMDTLTQMYTETSRANNIGFICDETGVNATVSHDVALEMLEDTLSAYQKYGCGWVIYGLRGDYGIINTGYLESESPLGCEYEAFSYTNSKGETVNCRLDRKMLELMQQYQQLQED